MSDALVDRPQRSAARRWIAPVATILGVVALSVAGCGDDDTEGAGAGGDDTTAACDAFVAVDEASFADDLEGIIAGITDFAAAAPDEVAAAVEPLIPLLETDPEAVDDSEELAVAEEASDAFAWDNCSDTRVELDAHNFAYTGMPATVEAGRVGFQLTNRTKTGEFHEALVLRRSDGIDEPPSEVLRAAIGDVVSVDNTFGSIESFTLVGGGLVEPEGSDVFVIDLEPGEYVLACMLPVDSPELLEAYFGGEEVDGTYHLEQGMFVDFTVG